MHKLDAWDWIIGTILAVPIVIALRFGFEWVFDATLSRSHADDPLCLFDAYKRCKTPPGTSDPLGILDQRRN